MPRLVKIVFGIVGMVIIILVVVILLGIRLVKKSLPQPNGTVVVVGLHHPVKIYRDQYGVPHIFAEDEEDLFFAQGYVHAQDRLWQMDMNRRSAMGTLSEIFGVRTLDFDKFIRTISIPEIANQLAEKISSESKMILAAYALGINAFLTQHPDQLPNEFNLLNYQPQPWQIGHSLAYQRLIAWSLEMAWRVDPMYGELVNRIGTEKVQEIIPDYPNSAPTIVGSESFNWNRLRDTFTEFKNSSTDLVGIVRPGMGSNSWVISGARSMTGKPILANDPHLAHQNPSIWYEVHMKAPGIDGYGVSFSGIPGIVIGHNQTIAWGLTNVMADGCDFFIEQMQSDSSDQYRYQDKWHETVNRQETIAVKNQPTVNLTIRATDHGPIISDLHPLLQNSANVVSMKWTGQMPSDEILAFYKILKAQNWDQFTGGLHHFSVPPQNYVYADRMGNIGYYCAGSIPIRKNGNGLLPQPGWLDNFEWKDRIPFEQLPHLYNPSENMIVTANNKVVNEKYPYFISTYWEPPYRAYRINELLTTKSKLSITDFKAIQMDLFSTHAQYLMPEILAVLPKLDQGTTLRAFFASSLKSWDFELSTESTGATIFELFLILFYQNIFQDEMGDSLFQNFMELPNIPIRVTDRLVAKGTSEWFDNIVTPEYKETLEDLLLTSLEETFQYLATNLGETVHNWQWGNIHRVKFEHPLAKEKLLERLFNIGPFPCGGSCTSVNAASYALNKSDFRVTVGPSMRHIVDLFNRKNSLMVITTGQSGQVLSKHYQDQTPLWRNGMYHSTLVDSLVICNSNFDRLILEPGFSK